MQYHLLSCCWETSRNYQRNMICPHQADGWPQCLAMLSSGAHIPPAKAMLKKPISSHPQWFQGWIHCHWGSGSANHQAAESSLNTKDHCHPDIASHTRICCIQLLLLCDWACKGVMPRLSRSALSKSEFLTSSKVRAKYRCSKVCWTLDGVAWKAGKVYQSYWRQSQAARLFKLMKNQKIARKKIASWPSDSSDRIDCQCQSQSRSWKLWGSMQPGQRFWRVQRGIERLYPAEQRTLANDNSRRIGDFMTSSPWDQKTSW